MALFKIFKGNQTDNLLKPTLDNGEINEFYRDPVDGYAYYDTNTKLFYIDAIYSGTAVTRQPINAYQAELAKTAVLAQAAVNDEDGNPIKDNYSHNLTTNGNTIRLKNKNDIDLGDKVSPIPYIVGDTTTAGLWTGTCSQITSYADGLAIIYKPIVAGGSTTTTLNINGLGAKTVYLNNTTLLTTHYPKNQPILLFYASDLNNGCWVASDYNSNTDTKIKVYKESTTTALPILAGRTKSESIKATGTAIYGIVAPTKAPTIRTSDGQMTVPGGIVANLSGTATYADRAVKDSDGNQINQTYLTDVFWSTTGLQKTINSFNETIITSTTLASILKLSNYLPLAGGTMTGKLILSGNPTIDNEAATKNYVDSEVGKLTGTDTYVSGASITASTKAGYPLQLILSRSGTLVTDVSGDIPQVSKISAGVVPALPSNTGTTQFFRQDGTWADITSTQSTTLVRGEETTIATVGGHDIKVILPKSDNTDSFIDAAKFDYDTELKNIKMTLTKGGTDTGSTVTGNIPVFTTTQAGLVPIPSSDTTNYFLKQDGTWSPITTAKTTTFVWGTTHTIATIGGNNIQVVMPNNPNTDIIGANFSYDSTTANVNQPIKLELIKLTGISNTATITGYIPKVSSAGAGVVPKGAAVETQTTATKFLREDGTWSIPSYTTTINWNQISNPPATYAPASHNHGNIENNGTISGNTHTIVENDHLILSTTNNEITQSALTFGTSANYALANDGTWQIFNNYSHPTGDGNKHIPSGGETGQFLGWASTGTAKWVNNPNTDTKNTAGAEGYVAKKLILIGAENQTDEERTFTNSSLIYMENEQLNTPSLRIKEQVTLQYDSATQALNFIFA